MMGATAQWMATTGVNAMAVRVEKRYMDYCLCIEPLGFELRRGVVVGEYS